MKKPVITPWIFEEEIQMSEDKKPYAGKNAVEGLRAVAAWNSSGRQEAVQRLVNLAKPTRRQSK